MLFVTPYSALLQLLSIMHSAREHGRVKHIPSNPMMVVEMLPSVLKSERAILDYISFYHLLKKIHRSPFKTQDEYHKNVALVVGDYKVTVDLLHLYYMKTKDFVRFAYNYVR